MTYESPELPAASDDRLLEILTRRRNIEPFDLSAYSAEPAVIRTQAINSRRVSDFELPAEPRWRDDDRDRNHDHDHDQSKDQDNDKGMGGGDLRELAPYRLSGDSARQAPGWDSAGRLPGLDRQVVEFDPYDLRSMASAAWQIAGPFSRLAASRLVDNNLPPGVEPRLRPLPSNAPNKENLQQLLGLPDGPLIPESLKESAARAYDAAVNAKPLAVATAAVVTTIALSATPNIGPGASAKPAAVVQLDHRSEKQFAVSLSTAPVGYVVSKPTHLSAIAIDLHLPVAQLLKANPNLDIKSEIQPGTVVGGTVGVSQMSLEKPVTVEQLAEQYGATTDAIASVNNVHDGEVSGLVNIPGRQIIPVDPASQVDTNAVAKHLDLGDSGSRELARVNASAPPGQLVVPLFSQVESQLKNPAIVAAVAVGDLPPSPPTTIADQPANSATSTTATPEVISSSTSVEASSAPSTSEAPSTTVAPVSVEAVPAPPPAPVLVQRPASAAEKMAADIEAVRNALDHALQTGDLGGLNHLVAHSPLFNGFDLNSEQQANGMRHIPPANLLKIPDLRYEFSPNTPDNERVANSYAISTFLYAAYAFRQEVKANPEWASQYPDACLKGGDFTARDGHVTHDRGINFDVNSVMHCNISHGHQAADGPVGWVNRSVPISHNIANPNYDRQLDLNLLNRMLAAQVGGQPIVTTILYNGPSPSPRVKAFPDHGNHQHFKIIGPQDTSIQSESHGGGRPEVNLNSLRGQILDLYSQGRGVDGLSKDLTITEEQAMPADAPVTDPVPVSTAPAPSTSVPPAPAPAPAPADNLPDPAATAKPDVPAAETAQTSASQKYQLGVSLLLNEIASGEGGYDSVNRHRAGDTHVGDVSYRRVLGDRMLSQLTIGEILKLQDQNRLLAVGRYQFIPDTFASAVRATGIDVKRTFDPKTQDELATNYLIFQKRPKLAAYLRGDAPEATVYTAVDDLCREFASMPCNDGTGNYDGDHAGNHASGGRARVKRIRHILEFVREVYPAAQKELKEYLASQAAKS